MNPSYPAHEWIPVVFGDAVFHNTVTQLISHPAEAATRTELHYFAPSTDNEAIDNALERLIEVGILQEIGEEPFIGFTEDGKQFIVDSRLYRGEEVLKAVYINTQLTDEVEAAADLPRPDWYLEEIAASEFDERDEIRQSSSFTDGWDRILYKTRLTITNKTGGTGLQATFERATGVRSDTENAEDYEVLVTDSVEFSAEAQDEITEPVEVSVSRESTESIMNCESADAYQIEFDEYVGGGTLSPSYSIDVKRRDTGSTVISAYVEPNN